jgi:hypothetical protein
MDLYFLLTGRQTRELNINKTCAKIIQEEINGKQKTRRKKAPPPP